MLVFEYQHGICGILLCRVFRLAFLHPLVLGHWELFLELRIESGRTNLHGRSSSKSLLKTFVILKMDVLVDDRTQLFAATELHALGSYQWQCSFTPLREPTSAPSGHLIP